MSLTSAPPAPAATALCVQAPEMTDVQMAKSTEARQLVVDWRAGTVTLAAAGSVDPRYMSSFPTPRIAADEIYTWLDGLLPAFEALRDGVIEPGYGAGYLVISRDEVYTGPVYEVTAKLDELFTAVCGRPAHYGLLAECTGCGHRIAARPFETTSWHLLEVPDAVRCVAGPRGHQPAETGPGSIRPDYRPHHELELDEHGTRYAGFCTCRTWQATTPRSYPGLLLAFDEHANGPAAP
jgi:hypothetical protein